MISQSVRVSNAQDLARTKVLETWIAGKQVWGGEPSAAPTERGK